MNARDRLRLLSEFSYLFVFLVVYFFPWFYFFFGRVSKCWQYDLLDKPTIGQAGDGEQ